MNVYVHLLNILHNITFMQIYAINVPLAAFAVNLDV